MKTTRKRILTIFLGALLIICLIFAAVQCRNDDTLFADYYQLIQASFPDTARWHLAIYMDIRTCLTCCEDMKSWQELETAIPGCGGTMSIWAPQADSLDVAEAMRLEGIKTPVRVIDQKMAERINKTEVIRPMLALFDSTGRLVLTRGALPSAKARQLDRQMQDTICSGK